MGAGERGSQWSLKSVYKGQTSLVDIQEVILNPKEVNNTEQVRFLGGGVVLLCCKNPVTRLDAGVSLITD